MINPTIQAIAYVMSPDRRRVLLIHRHGKPGDVHLGKYMGLGGHVERGEDVVAAVRREVAEESGLTATDLTLRGTVTWTDFLAPGEDSMAFVFRVDAFTGDPDGGTGDGEGTLEWVPLAGLGDRPMWDSDHLWLPMVFDDDPRQFHGVMPYAGAEMLTWSFTRM